MIVALFIGERLRRHGAQSIYAYSWREDDRHGCAEFISRLRTIIGSGARLLISQAQ